MQNFQGKVHRSAGLHYGTSDWWGNIWNLIFDLFSSLQLLVPLLTCGDGWQDVITRYNLSSNRNVQSAALVAMMQTQWPTACAVSTVSRNRSRTDYSPWNTECPTQSRGCNHRRSAQSADQYARQLQDLCWGSGEGVHVQGTVSSSSHSHLQRILQYIEMLAGAGPHFNELRIKRVAGMLTTELIKNFVDVRRFENLCGWE